eukprot:GHVQ01022259.1.p2 GENE.GHVQ01022259.1~~GHVQ01022259.1.p2  ORF type:complete len:120 (+),score=18.17 GHVQ01022259.1:104-463(+)
MVGVWEYACVRYSGLCVCVCVCADASSRACVCACCMHAGVRMCVTGTDVSVCLCMCVRVCPFAHCTANDTERITIYSVRVCVCVVCSEQRDLQGTVDTQIGYLVYLLSNSQQSVSPSLD